MWERLFKGTLNDHLFFSELHNPRDVLVVKEAEKGLTFETNKLCRTGMESDACVQKPDGVNQAQSDVAAKDRLIQPHQWANFTN